MYYSILIKVKIQRRSRHTVTTDEGNIRASNPFEVTVSLLKGQTLHQRFSGTVTSLGGGRVAGLPAPPLPLCAVLTSFMHTWQRLTRERRLPAFSVSDIGATNCS